MVLVARGWELDVERGPDWLFVRPQCPPADADEAPPLAEQIWALVEQSFTYRLVLELDRIDVLRSYLVGQLVWLQKRLHVQGGVLRICGLSERNRQVLEWCRLEGHFPQYADREAAVMCNRPQRPR